MDDALNLETLASLRGLDEPGKKEFLAEIIQAYMTDTEDRLKVLWTMHESGNLEGLAKIAHAIKGSSLNVGADGLAALMRAIEMDGKSGKVSNRNSINEAAALFQRFKQSLDSYLAAA